jgi:hypothetical protein
MLLSFERKDQTKLFLKRLYPDGLFVTERPHLRHNLCMCFSVVFAPPRLAESVNSFYRDCLESTKDYMIEAHDFLLYTRLIFASLLTTVMRAHRERNSGKEKLSLKIGYFLAMS